jgi:hypothetical protein
MRPSLQINLPVTEVESVNRDRLTTVDEINREREWLAGFVAARNKAGLSQQAAAFALGGISVQLLSAQENGVENKHLSFRRMWRLGPDFWAEMVELILKFHGLAAPGLSPQDEEDRRIGRAYRELQQQVARSVQR